MSTTSSNAQPTIQTVLDQKLINIELYANLTHLPEHMVEYTTKDTEKLKNPEQTPNPFSPSGTNNYPPMFTTKPLEQAELYTVHKLDLETPTKPTKPQQYVPPQSWTPSEDDHSFNQSLNNLPPSVITAVKRAITNETTDTTNANTAIYSNPDTMPLSAPASPVLSVLRNNPNTPPTIVLSNDLPLEDIILISDCSITTDDPPITMMRTTTTMTLLLICSMNNLRKLNQEQYDLLCKQYPDFYLMASAKF
ncbi:hypothetical protein P691DRAFT_768426 [Macrolepiota fuliginosa MF-IS2]|uniref:Uncharacterized protein n=1 Tax=Macrolepiota fuliginosa MF-IS2 TaxID=1400762 RepID=A0A9P5WY47_9AGAR|nr:hypothetical protein P691DRAFT_768426 [Macrolepiota fuliginosa MF-IS2]